MSGFTPGGDEKPLLTVVAEATEPKKRNWRTTTAGITTIGGAVLTFIAHALMTKQVPTLEMWSMLGAALTMGSGLIAAADGKNSK
jgi:hypothetical protein